MLRSKDMVPKCTLKQIITGNTCQPAVDVLTKYFTENNLTEISFDEVISLYKSLKKREWIIWAYNNKKVFAKLINYTIPEEEANADAIALADLFSGNPTGNYKVLDTIYPSLDAAKEVAENTLQNLIQQNLPKALGYATACLEVLNEDGTTTWSPIELQSAVEPTSGTWCYQVFNHLKGVHGKADTLAEAVALQQSLALQEATYNSAKPNIQVEYLHPDYPNEPYYKPLV